MMFQGINNKRNKQESDEERLIPKFKKARHTGSLVLSMCELKQIPEKVWNLSEETFGEKWWELVELTKLDISYNEITEISSQISNLRELKVFMAAQNNISSLPETFFDVLTLTKVDLSHNNISNISSKIGDLTCLEWLSLSHNNISELPSSLLHLRGLCNLDLSNNSLKELPPRFAASLPYLTTIKLAHNKLIDLPSDLLCDNDRVTEVELQGNRLRSLLCIKNMKKLERVDLRENALRELPEIDANIPIKELFLGWNAIDNISNSSALLSLNSLRTLDLSNNSLQKLTSNISQLQALHSLDIANNDLTGLPAELSLIPELSRLNVDGNPIKSIRRPILTGGTVRLLKYLKTRLSPEMAKKADLPENTCNEQDFWTREVQNVNSSGKIDFRDKKLEEIPQHFWESITPDTLSQVDLSRNRIERVPLTMSIFDSITHLVLCRNRFGGKNILPSDMDKYLPQLQHLDISFCKMTDEDMPERFPVLLEEVHFTANRLGSIPSGLKECKKLRELRLSTNQIHGSVPTWLKELTSLEILDLSDNAVNTLDVDILMNLKKLSVLNLTNNDLSKVPPELGLITSLRSLTLEGNPIRLIRRTVLQKPTSQLLEYLRSRIPQN
eukprot:gb/GECH01007799.1/.p1 GENE.gb/GECH01007799.1/~~gb/GECH01007799.1/.p1  ORF type:complete len:614 (+),score=171.24 gb/GECH01007799.1/:1-1842(+)